MTYGASGIRVAPGAIGTPTVGDIAQGLGRQYRFAGQTRIAYPVLAHSLVVANLVYHTTLDEKAAACALLHDAPEAFMGDVPTPWKPDEFAANERTVLAKILVGVGLTMAEYDERYWAIKAADRLALAAEAHLLGHPAAEKHWPDAGHDSEHVSARAFTHHQLGKVDSWRRVCDTYRNPQTARQALATALLRYGYPKAGGVTAKPDDYTTAAIVVAVDRAHALNVTAAGITTEQAIRDAMQLAGARVGRQLRARISPGRIARTFGVPERIIGHEPACSAVRVQRAAVLRRKAGE